MDIDLKTYVSRTREISHALQGDLGAYSFDLDGVEMVDDSQPSQSMPGGKYSVDSRNQGAEIGVHSLVIFLMLSKRKLDTLHQVRSYFSNFNLFQYPDFSPVIPVLPILKYTSSYTINLQGYVLDFSMIAMCSFCCS